MGGSVAEPQAGIPAGGAPAADAAAPMAEPDAAVPFMDYGEGDGSDVITIGDSWMTLGFSGIEQSLRAAGKNYRNYAAPGTTLGGSIPSQYTRAKSSNPDIKTVIMTGGGNDIMFSNGCATTEACEESVRMIVMMLNTLWTEMAMDGVKDVLYINYSSDAGTAPQGTRPTMPPAPPEICTTGMIRCHRLATTDLVMGQLLDGIHPTPAANDRIAAAVIELLEMVGARR
jgi:lysophospholipase L1-like esterase